MRVDVTSLGDFHRLAVPAYAELIHQPGPGRPRLEILLAPGDYVGSGLTLGGPRTIKPNNVSVRGADPNRPPVLTDVALSLFGREVRLEHLVFESTGRDLPMLHGDVRASIEISRCAFICNQTRAVVGGRLLELVAADPELPATATIRGSWFIGNRAPERSSLIGFNTVPPRTFGRVTFDEVAFLDNLADCSVVPGLTEAVVFARCVVHQRTTAATPSPLFVAVNATHTRVDFSDSVVVGYRPETLVSRRSATTGTFQPVVVRDSQVLFETPPLSNLPGYAIERSTIGSAGSIHPATRSLDEWIEAARRGIAPDRAALRAGLGLPVA